MIVYEGIARLLVSAQLLEEFNKKRVLSLLSLTIYIFNSFTNTGDNFLTPAPAPWVRFPSRDIAVV